MSFIVIFEFSSIVFTLLEVIDGTNFNSSFDDIVPTYPVSIVCLPSSDVFVFSFLDVIFTVSLVVLSVVSLFSVVVFWVLFVSLACSLLFDETVVVLPSTSSMSFLT